MIVSAWYNGDTVFGIKIGRADRPRHFSRDWDSVRIAIAGQAEIACPLVATFWGSCPVIRATALRDWFEKLGHVKDKKKNWQKRQPPKFRLISVSGNRFALEEME